MQQARTLTGKVDWHEALSKSREWPMRLYAYFDEIMRNLKIRERSALFATSLAEGVRRLGLESAYTLSIQKMAPFMKRSTALLDRAQTAVGITDAHDKFALYLRWFAWSIIGLMAVYLLNCYLSYWQNWPSALPLIQDGELGVLTFVQTAFYFAAIWAAAVFVIRTAGERTLRTDSDTLNGISTFIIRAAFWSVLLVGCVDATISFLRVEGLLDYLVGTDVTKALGRSHVRATYIHIPLCVAGIYIATRRTEIDFVWLALLVVASELLIVITRFVFSYEQAFMGDLVRFWYAALFLFASAYTLYTDQHVRVDVFYSTFSQQKRSTVNAIGAVLLGMLLCWTILLMGMWNKSSILIAPVLGFEVSQSGFGMYVKYLMASFLSIFAISMMAQFASSLLESAADYRGEPGARELEPAAAD